MEEAINCRGLKKTYHTGENDTFALRGVDLTVHSGELFMLVGPSGCGKTTLLSIVAAILNHDVGQCDVFGRDLSKLNDAEKTRFRKENVGFVFQAFNLIPTLTVSENVAVPLLIQGVSFQEAVRRAQAVLDRVGLSSKINENPLDLSGGQQQRVAVARALIHQPKLIVCDEPTSALDKDTGQHIIELFREVALTENRTLLIVTHDSRIYRFADRIAVMNDGLIERVVNDPQELEVH
jgi:putative ABC transport system ATP-binding protein